MFFCAIMDEKNVTTSCSFWQEPTKVNHEIIFLKGSEERSFHFIFFSVKRSVKQSCFPSEPLEKHSIVFHTN